MMENTGIGGHNFDIEKFLSEAVRRITQTFSPEKIILFGSYACGTATSDSDVDLMVIMETNEKPHKRSVQIRKILKNTGVPKDIIVKTPLEFERFKDIIGTIEYPAAHRGRVLYEK